MKRIVFSLIFSLLAAIPAVGIYLLLARVPVISQADLVFFDLLQYRHAVDSKSDADYAAIAPYTDNLLLIDIDSAFIDPATDKIRIANLTDFLHAAAPHAAQMRCLFFDYGFFTPSPDDSAFIAAMRPFGNKLLLPLTFVLESGKDPKSKENAFNISNLQKPLHQPGYPAYVKAFADGYTRFHRYVIYSFNTASGDTLNYMAKTLAQHYAPTGAQANQAALHNTFQELRYLLRNDDIPGKERALPVYTMSDLILEIDNPGLKDLFRDKIVVCGLTGSYQTKYGLEIDKFATPVKSNLSGPLVIVNAYLGLMTGKILRPASLLTVVAVIFALMFVLCWLYMAATAPGANFLRGFLSLGILAAFGIWVLPWLVAQLFVVYSLKISLWALMVVLAVSLPVFLLAGRNIQK